MAALDPLIVKLIAENRDFNDNMAKSQRIADTRLTAIEARGQKMGQGLKQGFGLAKAAAVGFVASIGVDTVLRAINSGLQYAASLGEVAQQLGVTTDALQEYRYAGSQAGLATEEIDMALGQLTRRIGEGVNGTKAQAEAFEKLGISLKDAEGNVLATGDAIPKIAEALKTIKSPAEQSALLLDLFGKSGQKLLSLLSQGASGVNGLRDAAQKLGIVLSSEQIAKADDTADKLDALKQVLSAKIAATVADNSTSILSLADAIGSLVSQVGPALAKYKEFVGFIERNSARIQTGGGRLQVAFGLATGNAAFIQNGAQVTEQGRQRQLAAGAPTKRRGGFIANKTNFATGGLDQILGREGLGAPGAGTGLDIKNLQGLLVAELFGPTKAQAKAISAATVVIEQKNADIALALAELSGSITERAAAEKLRIDSDARADAERIKADSSIKGVARERQLADVAELALIKKRIIDQQLAKELADKSLENAEKLARAREENVSLELDALDAESSIATSVKARAAIELRMLEIQQAEEKSRLEAQIAAGEIADAAKARADLARKQGADRQGLANASKGAAGTELDRINALNFGDESEKFGVDALNELNRGLADAIVNGGNLGDVLEDTGKRFIAQLIEMAFQLLVIKPLLEGLKAATDGDSTTSFITGAAKAVTSLFAAPRASGGPVQGGQVYRVNESQKEFFRPNVGGDIIPLSRMNIAQSGGAQRPIVLKVYADEGSTFVPRVEAISGQVSVQVVRASAPTIIDAGANEALRRSGRARM